MDCVNVGIDKTVYYKIYIKDNIFVDTDLLKPLFCKYSKAMIITDDNVRLLHLDKVIAALKPYIENIYIFCLYAKETSKSIQNAEKILAKLADNKFRKDDIIISLGGGMVSDIAGFCASVYKRGCALAHVPTTVLAQVDASIGGKTAVNTGMGKNMIGTIYHPNFVLCDTSLLSTLSDEAYFESFAEIIKYALICDRELFEYLENTDTIDIRNNIATVITKCVNHKAGIVAIDDADNNERLKLNFGHTIAHAIEKYYGYKIYSHPRAVGIGMYSTVLICENEGICKQGAAQRVKTLLEKFSLEYKMPQISKEDFYAIIANDKKLSAGGLKETVICDIGESKIILLDDDKIKNIAEKYLKELK